MNKENTIDNGGGRAAPVNLDRRKFLSAAVLAGAGTAMQPLRVFAGKESDEEIKDPARFAEPAHKLPLQNEFDVIVCGGGPAGIAAAVTAARAGARTQLLEVNGCLGGVWTAGLLTWVFDFNRPGITEELVKRLDEKGARRSADLKDFTYSPEAMKLVLEEMCAEAGVSFLLHYRVTAAYRDKNRISTIITESKSGRQAWKAKVFIDCTGDGDVGAFIGNGWDIGHGGDTCPCQPLTLNTLAVVRDAEALKEFISFYQDDSNGRASFVGHRKASQAFKGEINRAGLDPSYGDPTLFLIKDNLVMIMVNHEYDVKAFDAVAVSKATVDARAEVNRIVDALNKLGKPWEGLQVVSTAEQIGIRDGRRLHGRYTVTRDDLLHGSHHDDGVTVPTFGVDIHAPNKESNKIRAISNGDFKMKPYDIPLRALIAKDVDGLMMAGRCISGDFYAHASYRVTGDAVAMGQAAGAVAALASRTNRLPHEVPWNEGEALLKKLGQGG